MKLGNLRIPITRPKYPSSATLTPEFLKNFQENFKEFSKPKTKKLQEAIKLALQMVEEEEEEESEGKPPIFTHKLTIV